MKRDSKGFTFWERLTEISLLVFGGLSLLAGIGEIIRLIINHTRIGDGPTLLVGTYALAIIGTLSVLAALVAFGGVSLTSMIIGIAVRWRHAGKNFLAFLLVSLSVACSTLLTTFFCFFVIFASGFAEHIFQQRITPFFSYGAALAIWTCGFAFHGIDSSRALSQGLIIILAHICFLALLTTTIDQTTAFVAVMTIGSAVVIPIVLSNMVGEVDEPPFV